MKSKQVNTKTLILAHRKRNYRPFVFECMVISLQSSVRLIQNEYLKQKSFLPVSTDNLCNIQLQPQSVYIFILLF